MMARPYYPLLLAAATVFGAWPWCDSATSQELRFTAVDRAADGTLQLQLSGTTGDLYRLDVSVDPAVWEPYLTFEGTGNDTHVDTASPFVARRNYRAEEVTDAEALPGDHVATAAGDVLIRPLTHATFVMRWNGLMIYNDPDSPADYTGLSPADLILVSHTHGDHFDQNALEAVRKNDTIILAPQEVYDGMNTTLRGLTTVMGNGDTNQILGINVRAVPAYNDVYHPVGTGNGYILTVGGKTFYMSGDTGDIAEMRALEDIDVAFVCMNLPFTMSVDQAADAIRDFAPAVVYPYHYRNGNGTFADLEYLKTLVGGDLPIEIRVRDWY